MKFQVESTYLGWSKMNEKRPSFGNISELKGWKEKKNSNKQKEQNTEN